MAAKGHAGVRFSVPQKPCTKVLSLLVPSTQRHQTKQEHQLLGDKINAMRCSSRTHGQ